MKNIFLLCLSFNILTLCAQEIDLHKEKKNQISYSQLPKVVQLAFFNAYNRDTTDQGKVFMSGRVEPEFVNLDSKVTFVNESIQGKSGVRPGVRVFVLNNKKFQLAWNGNRENPPFIFYDGKIYYSIEMNVWSEEDIKSAQCEYIDISKYLK